jgi:hypothetical protein
MTHDSDGKPKHERQNVKILNAASSITEQQIPLFARKALIEFPPSKDTADSLGEVVADDQHRYFIKGDAHGRRVRASEWICTAIAEEVHFGAPTPMVIIRQDGTTVFGSRKIAGVNDELVTHAFLTDPTGLNSGQQNSNLGRLVSAIYALDMFLFNDDRHFGNYLSVDDAGTRRLYTFDFSRALFWNWPFEGFPNAVNGLVCNTRKYGAQLRNLHGWHLEEALIVLDRLASVDSNTVEGFVNRMPPEWLPDDELVPFLAWWSDGRRHERLEALRKGMTDGTLL